MLIHHAADVVGFRGVSAEQDVVSENPEIARAVCRDQGRRFRARVVTAPLVVASLEPDDRDLLHVERVSGFKAAVAGADIARVVIEEYLSSLTHRHPLGHDVERRRHDRERCT